MRGSLAAGLVLILLGAAILAWPVISWTERDTVVDFGPVEVVNEDREHVTLPRILGGAILVTGAILALMGGRRRMV